MLGFAEVRHPAACDADQYGASGWVTVFVDGEPAGTASSYFYAGSAGQTLKVGVYFYTLAGLMAPGSDESHVITARVSDSCTGADQNFTFKSLKLDVVAVG